MLDLLYSLVEALQERNIWASLFPAINIILRHNYRKQRYLLHFRKIRIFSNRYYLFKI